ncbi:vacuolar protein sorting-associated protein 26C [Chironomus tepperi]|uniref:vacuolar protein sorting-associated protein 26C n=1 Tax=Chironomus tepperi TaxID=113505 RepID=UPI00391FB7DF
MSVTLDIRLKKTNKTYNNGDLIKGVVIINSNSDIKHDGLSLNAEGFVGMQLSNKNTGVFEAFYNSVNKPIILFNHTIELLAPGKISTGITEVEFEFMLEPKRGSSEGTFYESYSGVFICVSYFIKCELKRKFLAKDCQAKIQFFVQNHPQKIETQVPVHFSISPETLQKSSKEKIHIPRFLITGTLDTTSCCITKPLNGTITIQHTEMPIKSIEIQLVRVETCGCAEGFSRDATEIQNLQIADGNVCPKIQIPIYMQFPRLFTCPTLQTRNFKIQFELNLCIIFRDDYLITENFQVQLFRSQ